MSKKLADHIWFNGEIIPWEKATVHVLTHAIHYGSSVFEGVRAYDTPDKGPCVFRMQEHTRRLFDSAKVYRMTIPHTQDDINEATLAINANLSSVEFSSNKDINRSTSCENGHVTFSSYWAQQVRIPLLQLPK